MKYQALSIVHPSGSKIASGEKTIEVRSWLPPKDLTGDLLIIENHRFLTKDGDVDEDGNVVAVVKIKNVRPYLESDIPAACATRWEPGYYSWELTEVRKVQTKQKVLAARGIYEVDVELDK